MDVRLVNPFLDAITAVLPQLGIADISRSKVLTGDQFVASKGVTVMIGMTHQVTGIVAYNLSEETAKHIASTMMMGMPVTELGTMEQSALSEMVNMVTANAAIQLEQMGMHVDISPPTVVVGSDYKSKICNGKYLAVELLVNGMPLEVDIGLDAGNG